MPCAQDGNDETLLARSIEGGKWVAIISTLGTVVGLATNLVLARIGPEVLGLYGLILLAIYFVAAVLFPGGAAVVVRFLAQEASETKISFLFSYLALLLGFAVAVLVLVSTVPTFARLLPMHEAGGYGYRYVALLAPMVLLQIFAAAALFAEMDLQLGAALQNLAYLPSFVVFAILAATKPVWLDGATVIIVVLCSYSLSAIFGWAVLYKRHIVRWTWNISFRFPRGFAQFALWLYMSNLVFFLFNNLDQVLVANSFGAKGLGYYRAARSIAGFAQLVPSFLSSAMLSGFSNTVGDGDTTAIRTAYGRYVGLTAAMSTFLTASIILFRREVLAVFGSGFIAESEGMLVVIAAASAVYSVSLPAGSLLLAQGRAGLGLILNASAVVVQPLSSVLLASVLGPMSIALGYALSLLALSLALCWAAARCYGLVIERKVWAMLALAALLVSPFLLLDVELFGLAAFPRLVVLAILGFCLLRLRLVDSDDLSLGGLRLHVGRPASD